MEEAYLDVLLYVLLAFVPVDCFDGRVKKGRKRDKGNGGTRFPSWSVRLGAKL